jgi:hypothetical protein
MVFEFGKGRFGGILLQMLQSSPYDSGSKKHREVMALREAKHACCASLTAAQHEHQMARAIELSLF